MRCALILPAPVDGPGGVQRFGSCLAPALASVADVWLYRLHPRPGRSRAAALAAGARDLCAGHRRHRFDVVISTFHWPPRVSSLPMVGVVHDLRRHGGGHSRSAAARVQRAILSTWDLVLVPTHHVRAEVMALCGHPRIVVVGEGTDHLDAHATPADRRLLVVLGGRSPHKRSELGLQAAEEAASRLGAEGVVLGASPRHPSGRRIRVLEAPSDQEIAAAHARARVVVAPSRYEGFGLAAGEALRLGAPVVFAADGTLAGLVQGGGLAAAPTVSAMADAVVEAWGRAETLSRGAREAVRALTWEATARRIIDEIGLLLEDDASRGRGNRRSSRSRRGASD